MQLLIVAGEISSDQYVPNLVQSLRRIQADIKVIGVGGAHTQSVADEFLMDVVHDHAIGITEVMSKKKQFRQVKLQLESYLSCHPIDHVVLMDYPHFNFPLAKLFQSFHLPITTFISPNFWIWNNKKQGKRLAAYSKQIITIFKKEKAFYDQFSQKVSFFGHPKLEMIPPVPRSSLSSPYVVGIMPGSREQEIHYHLDPMLEACKALKARLPDTVFKLAISADTFKPLIQQKLAEHQLDVSLVQGPYEQWFKQVDTVITVAGTATLEAALLGVPQVIVGAVSPLTHAIAKYLLRLKITMIGLPNIVMGRFIVPEFIQYDMKPEPMCEALLALANIPNRQKMCNAYAALRKELSGGSNMFDQVAHQICFSIPKASEYSASTVEKTETKTPK